MVRRFTLVQMVCLGLALAATLDVTSVLAGPAGPRLSGLSLQEIAAREDGPQAVLVDDGLVETVQVGNHVRNQGHMLTVVAIDAVARRVILVDEQGNQTTIGRPSVISPESIDNPVPAMPASDQDPSPEPVDWPEWGGGLAAPQLTFNKETPLTQDQLFEQARRSVHLLVVTRQASIQSGIISRGSAVAITEELLLTNCHIVEEELKPMPNLSVQVGRQFHRVSLAQAEPDTDRCVIRCPHCGLQAVPGVRPADDLEVGEPAYTVGYPGRARPKLGVGRVARLQVMPWNIDFVQTDAFIAPGSSGGGLFDAYGNLIGITTSQLVGSKNTNFAIAIDEYWRD